MNDRREALERSAAERLDAFLERALGAVRLLRMLSE